ncbi:MAG: lipid-A-disaccharide synthase [Gammaproteobacteria bacterium]|nr:lipid-A-disaccharide synthase [Gammaproteobacteria bacterium]MBU1554696.1 lipid-A-disaccharide synthase [Gammaproteobacteria bacterium]MBU2072139.1 lipid-A-disaccharide synthase [Gammaproteobacteria bacterium]MBU2182582.1 lipid-A-disaccharide synthase [Gammaproteobacteria bacterium]MBU2204984.1 lipid-A-disaccharide synthase [Gammaproteobacteria bacterium]
MPLREPLKIAIIAGEHSGDILGADLITALQATHPNAVFYGIGGPRMQALGFTALFDMEELAVMGIVEVLGRLPRLLQVKREILAALMADKPDVFIGIDAPDFNLPVELQLKQAGIKTVHYVSPSVWAWRHKRIFKIAAATNMVLSLLPFEKAFYDKYQVPCTFVGHTMADAMPLCVDKAAAKAELGLDPAKTVIAIMPGSRTNEIKLLAPDFLQAALLLQQELPDLQFVTNMVTSAKAEQFNRLKQQIAPDLVIQQFTGQARQVLLAADATFITSGTATLEAMLAKCLMVVAYRANWLTYQIGKRLVKLAHFSLPNLLAGRGMVPELLQQQVTPQALVAAMLPQLTTSREALLSEYCRLHQSIKCDASAKAAQAILQVVKDDAVPTP